MIEILLNLGFILSLILAVKETALELLDCFYSSFKNDFCIEASELFGYSCEYDYYKDLIIINEVTEVMWDDIDITTFPTALK